MRLRPESEYSFDTSDILEVRLDTKNRLTVWKIVGQPGIAVDITIEDFEHILGGIATLEADRAELGKELRLWLQESTSKTEDGRIDLSDQGPPMHRVADLLIRVDQLTEQELFRS